MCGACDKKDCDCECHDITASTSHLREYVKHKKLELTGHSSHERLNRNQIFGLFSKTDDPERTLAQAQRFCIAIENSQRRQVGRSAINKKKKQQTECDDDV